MDTNNSATKSQIKETNAQQQKKSRTDFVFLDQIGEGSFSTVHLVVEKNTDRKFAIKECDKYQILKEKKVKYIHQEKSILAEILTDHPFIIKLCFTFHDESSLYFGLTYCSNGDLLDYRRKNESFFRANIYYSQFYAAEIVDALEYMHSKNVVHRDVKPENILVDERRHIRITDFGTARIMVPADEEVEEDCVEQKLDNLNLNEDNDEEVNNKPPVASKTKHKRSNSFVGTAQYVTPEILKSKPVHRGTDLWALGCIVFQLLTGKLLFTGNHEYDIFQKVIKLAYTIPDDFPDENAKDLIGKLIVFEPSKRLGVKENGGFEKLREHTFFNSINWIDLGDQEAPDPKAATTANFSTKLLYSNQSKLIIEDCVRDGVLNLTKQERELRLRIQSTTNIYHKFLQNNLIIKQGILFKKKDMIARKRMFVLTEGPHLFYIDTDKMELKGDVPWSREMRCEIKNFQIFFIHVPKRKYHLIDETSCSVEWCRRIMEVKNYYFK